MILFTAYVAGPVLRSERFNSLPIRSLYAELKITAEAHRVQIALPTYSDQLNDLPPSAFVKEIRDRIRKADATIAVIARPTDPNDLSGYSIAVEAQEAALAGKPIAILMEDSNLAMPRLLATLNRAQKYFFAGPETLNLMFNNLAGDIERRVR